MSYDTIALNCLIIPIGKLMNIPGIKLIQAIVVRKHEGARYIEAEIQNRLGAPFNKIPLKICIIQAESVIEREMDGYDQFSEIFSFDEEPKAEHFHITVATSSQEVKELLDRIASLEEALNMCLTLS